ncbi:MAG: Asp-tRNA(Asn)/Glu-tRNA(Gln) amidotransferase subunit GatC [Candidatus Shapirobacteria bacterium]|nr:Asp-tRNA(Asn)/Glu-tRNA(Gln) amidotransferase subunit GatC [Candidatus Shapirobacteria bacterium]
MLKTKKQNSKLSQKEVEHVAKLANLTLNSSDLEKFQKQLSEILNYAEILKEVDIKDVEPTSQVTSLENITHIDKAEVSLTQKETLSGSKNTYNGLFKIKRVLDK